jgi:hypothetical protein
VLELTSEVRAQGNMEGMMRSAVTEMRRAFGASRGRIRLFNQDVEGSSVAGSGVDGASGNELNRRFTGAEDDQT